MMNIIRKIAEKQQNLYGCANITIGFLGDSVTQGCFELYEKEKGSFETVFDQEHGYHNYVKQILAMLYSNVPINIINGGISGDSAPNALKRMDRDVLSHKPDLVVVCFGLNDCGNGLEGISNYKEALKGIFEKIKEADAEVIFMTPNMMNSDISWHIDKNIPVFREIAENLMALQNGGVLDAYMDAAREVCTEQGVTVCDCYRKWKKLEEGQVVISDLLSNYVNHPTRQMNWLFAVSLVETMFGM